MEEIKLKLKQIKVNQSIKENIFLIDEINSLLKDNKEIQALNINNVSSYLSLVINANEDEISEQVKDIQKEILDKMNSLITEFNDKCIEDKNYLKKYLSIIRKKSSKNNLIKKDLFKDVYCDDGISQFFVDSLLGLFYEIISIYPAYLFNNINNVVLVIKNDDGFSYSDCANNLIYLAKDDKKSVLILLSELVHEMTHLLEFHNKELNKLARNYIKQRSNGVQDTIKNLSIKYNKAYNLDIGEEVVFDIQSEDFYSGKIYTNKMTELISNGIEYYINNHICFMFLDPEYTKFLLNIFELEAKVEIQTEKAIIELAP